MDFILFSIILLFAVYGVRELIEGWAGRYLCPGPCDECIIICVKSSGESIEAVVRSLMLKNPDAELIIIDEAESDAVRAVLDRLCRDCARLHVKGSGQLEIKE